MSYEKNIDYDDLKKGGFLRAKQENGFTLRTRKLAGNYTANQLRCLAEIADEFGQGIVHLTVRQGIEVPFVEYKDIENIKSKVQEGDVDFGTSGPRLRATTCCPGNSWCKRGLINTLDFAQKLEKERGVSCPLRLPQKFKIAISGCPNMCTRGQVSEIGVFGRAGIHQKKSKIGYGIYVGGCGGRNPRVGIKIDKIFDEEEVLTLIERIVDFYNKCGKPKQRLGAMIEELGEENFLSKIREGLF
ncbi:MAG: hypothetical protein GY853_12450 [PVC group bacterium]|nr:hypothetical protein [PVC group bacterium]